MSDPHLALQRAVVGRLRSTPLVTALVPADRITVRRKNVTAWPVVFVGEGQVVDPELSLMRDVFEVYLDLHAFDRAADGDEIGFTDLKRVTGAIRKALMDSFYEDVDGFDLFDVHIVTTRFMHDPDGVTVHAAITIRALAKEIA